MNMKLQKTVRIFADKHLENIGNVFESLYKDSLLTDCVLYCKDGAIKAHKVILAASSRYFRQVFIDHADDKAIFMYGISYIQLKNLVELIYRGCIDVPSDNFNSVFGLVEELKVTGVIVDASTDIKSNGIGRDTRFKGQKRVAVDFEIRDDHYSTSTPKAQLPHSTDYRRTSSSSDIPTVNFKKDPENEQTSLPPPQEEEEDELNSSIEVKSNNEEIDFVGHDITNDQEHGEPLSIWAKKERKFKCDLCPSSFKRASHLSRHQLVHTGERPYACDQCEKAFSRHDKLKHHIHKAHELAPLNDALGPDSLYTIDHVDILTPETNMVESSNTILSPFLSEPNTSSYSSGEVTEPPQKKGRGRPRKYPAAPKPLVKRPRGRPRINPVVARPLIKRPRGRPRTGDIGSFGQSHSYPYHSDSFSDLNYLYKSQLDSNNSINATSEMGDNNSEIDNDDSELHEQGFMEPFVEIKTEASEKMESNEDEELRQSATSNFFENIGLFEKNTAIAKIGECTISVAASSNSSNNLNSMTNAGTVNN